MQTQSEQQHWLYATWSPNMQPQYGQMKTCIPTEPYA